MATIFTKIINGEIPCHKVAETEDFLAFLDIRPLAKGHTLCIPKKTEEGYIFNLDDETYTGLHLFAKKVAEAVEANTTCKRLGSIVIGTEVPHTHIHLVPFQHEGQMSFSSPRVNMSQEEMVELAKKIKTTFDAK